MDYTKIIEFQYPTAVTLKDYRLKDGGDGVVYISKWDENILGVQPTDKELSEIEASQEYQDWLSNFDPRTEKEKAIDAIIADYATSKLLERL